MWRRHAGLLSGEAALRHDDLKLMVGRDRLVRVRARARARARAMARARARARARVRARVRVS
jgi:hypothetical protein